MKWFAFIVLSLSVMGCAILGPKTQKYNYNFKYLEVGTPVEFRSKAYPKPDTFAKYPGGKDRLNKHIYTNTRYPISAYKRGEVGDMLITFVVGTDGRTKDIEVIESPSKDITSMISRIIQKMDRWEPAVLDGEFVEQKYDIKMKFNRLQDLPR